MAQSSYGSVLVQALVLVLLVHVLDVVFQEQDVGLAVAVHLDGQAVVPLDGAADLLAILQLDDHARLVVHLLLVIEALGVGLLRRDGLADPVRLPGLELLLDLGEIGTDQLAVHEGVDLLRRVARRARRDAVAQTVVGRVCRSGEAALVSFLARPRGGAQADAAGPSQPAMASMSTSIESSLLA